MENYLVKKEKGRFYYTDTKLLDGPVLKLINHSLRLRMLKMLSKEPMYASEIAKRLNMHEQRIYYHIKQLLNAGVLDIVEKKEIRGTVAKRYSPSSLNFTISLDGKWKEIGSLITKEREEKLNKFLGPFIKEGELSASIVVGSPDPHGPYKARARDGHYAVDLALFLGQFTRTLERFSVKLDVDTDIDKPENLILVGGPVTNLAFAKINSCLPVKFSSEEPWELVSERTQKRYSDDATGLIARIPHFKDSSKTLLVLAGIKYGGTKAAIIALTRHYKELLQTFNSQKAWASVVQGFDLDGDGKIDSIEVLE